MLFLLYYIGIYLFQLTHGDGVNACPVFHAVGDEQRVAAQLIDAETLGMETAEDFTPYTVAHLGDTLFIANIGKAGSSLLLFSIKKGERLGTLQSWQHDGGEKSFGSQIEAIVPSGNRLYVAERQSRLHVFQLPELSYLTCKGNGERSGPVVQAQVRTVTNECRN